MHTAAPPWGGSCVCMQQRGTLCACARAQQCACARVAARGARGAEGRPCARGGRPARLKFETCRTRPIPQCPQRVTTPLAHPSSHYVYPLPLALHLPLPPAAPVPPHGAPPCTQPGTSTRMPHTRPPTHTSPLHTIRHEHTPPPYTTHLSASLCARLNISTQSSPATTWSGAVTIIHVSRSPTCATGS